MDIREAEKEGNVIIELTSMESGILFTILDQKSACAKKSILKMIEANKKYKSNYTRFKNNKLVEWQELIDEFTLRRAREIMNNMNFSGEKNESYK